MVEGDFREQALKARPLLQGAAAASLILVDDQDPFWGPPKGGGIIGQGILTFPRFLVVKDLLGVGLADVDNG